MFVCCFVWRQEGVSRKVGSGNATTKLFSSCENLGYCFQSMVLFLSRQYFHSGIHLSTNKTSNIIDHDVAVDTILCSVLVFVFVRIYVHISCLYVRLRVSDSSVSHYACVNVLTK